MNRRLLGALAGGVAFAAVAACSGDDGSTDGDVIDVFGPYRRAEADAFAEVLQRFADREGIEVRYTGSADFVLDLRNRLVGDQQPDLAIVPQPGLVEYLDDRGLLVEHGDATLAVIADGAEFVDIVPGHENVAVPYRSTIKSLVWYRPEVFAANGWQVPRTLLELERLVNQVAAATEMAPWCFTIASGAATGWPGTDWIEDLVLRLHGPDVYDAWRDGEVAFSDDRIVEAFELLDRLVLTEGHVAGGQRTLLQTDVDLAGLPLFDERPGCAMYKQASFAVDWFPASTSIGPDADVDWFVVPGAEVDPAPVVVGGDSIVAFDDRPEVDRLVAMLASEDGRPDARQAGGYLGGRVDLEAGEAYPAELRPLAALLDAEVVRFDASDAMEPEFGSGAFWQGITIWMSALEPLPTVLADLDAERAVGG